MKIENKVLLSVDSSDLVDGKFYNDQIEEVADRCFIDMDDLVEVSLPKCKKIGSDCFRYNRAFTTFLAPLLKECGNYCFRDNLAFTTFSAPLLKNTFYLKLCKFQK